jgi:hypothetical protein
MRSALWDGEMLVEIVPTVVGSRCELSPVLLLMLSFVSWVEATACLSIEIGSDLLFANPVPFSRRQTWDVWTAAVSQVRTYICVAHTSNALCHSSRAIGPDAITNFSERLNATCPLVLGLQQWLLDCSCCVSSYACPGERSARGAALRRSKLAHGCRCGSSRRRNSRAGGAHG